MNAYVFDMIYYFQTTPTCLKFNRNILITWIWIISNHYMTKNFNQIARHTYIFTNSLIQHTHVHDTKKAINTYQG